MKNNDDVLEAWRAVQRALDDDSFSELVEAVAATDTAYFEPETEFTIELATVMVDVHEELIQAASGPFTLLEGFTLERAGEYLGHHVFDSALVMQAAEEYETDEFPEIWRRFDAEVLPYVRKACEQDGVPDYAGRSEAFNDWTDMLCKEGEITDWQYNNITHPGSCLREDER